MKNPFRYFNFSPDVFRLTLLLHVRFLSSPLLVKDLLFERGIEILHETIRCW